MNDVQPIPIPEEPIPATDVSDVTVVESNPVKEKKNGAVGRAVKHIFLFLILAATCALFAAGGYVLGSKRATVEKLMNISFDSSALFTKINDALLSGTAGTHSFEVSADMLNDALHAASSAFNQLTIRISDDSVYISGQMETSVLQNDPAALPEFLFHILPQQTQISACAKIGYTDGQCTVDVKSAEMFGAALDEESVKGFGLGQIAADYINEQIAANIPQEVTLNNIRAENGKLFIDLTF